MRFVFELDDAPSAVDVAHDTAEHDVRTGRCAHDGTFMSGDVERQLGHLGDDQVGHDHAPPPGRWSLPQS